MTTTTTTTTTTTENRPASSYRPTTRSRAHRAKVRQKFLECPGSRARAWNGLVHADACKSSQVGPCLAHTAEEVGEGGRARRGEG
eukprot:9362734-Alexandrium_andersonii.AAC.1